MTAARTPRWAGRSIRVVAGIGVATIAIAATVAGVVAPWPVVRAQPISILATPAPSESVLACDGPVLALGRTVEQASEFSIAAPQAVIAGPPTTSFEQTALAGPAGAEATVLSAPPADRAAVELAAAGSVQIGEPDLAGFAASACTPPLLESWLVAGATTTGSNDLIVVSNPGEAAATVQLVVFGAGGQLAPPGGADLIVAAGAQVAVPLAGLLLDEESPVVRVSASGAPVRASLQSSEARLLTPAGLDQVGAVTAASVRQVLPGITVSAGAEDGEPATILRLLAPATDGDAVVTVTPADGGSSASASLEPVPLAAGVPSAVALGELAPGRYTVTVEGSVPLVAGVRQTAGSDFAWSAAAPELRSPAVLAVPAGPEPVLTLANPGSADAAISVVPLSGGGEAVSLTIAGRASATVPVAPGTTYRLEPAAPVHASVGFSSGNALAAFAVWGADAASPPLTVYP